MVFHFFICLFCCSSEHPRKSLSRHEILTTSPYWPTPVVSCRQARHTCRTANQNKIPPRRGSIFIDAAPTKLGSFGGCHGYKYVSPTSFTSSPDQPAVEIPRGCRRWRGRCAASRRRRQTGFRGDELIRNRRCPGGRNGPRYS